MQKIGGQAVVNGVMMLKGNNLAVAVRKGNKIVVRKEKVNLLGEKFRKFYFIRGIFHLYDMLKLGIKSLSWSADQASDEPEKKSSPFFTFLVFILSIAIALIVFKGIPLLIASILVEKSNIIFNLVDGITKLLLFIGYVYAISLMKDVRTLFQYHGAEHKAVNCYESMASLTLENAKKCPTYHQRCGTNFLTIFIVISVFFYSLIPFNFSLLSKYLLRVLFLPIIVGVSFEVLKFSDRFHISFLNYPGKLIQRITSKEPTEKQLKVGVIALKSVL